jgi:uncharacterized protein YkwD
MMIGIIAFVSQNPFNFSEMTPRLQPDNRQQETTPELQSDHRKPEVPSNIDQSSKVELENQQAESKTAVYNKSIWPCRLNSDSSGKIDIDCFVNGLYHFNNIAIPSLSIDKVKLTWNAKGNYQALEQKFSDTKTYDLGHLVSKESSNTPLGSSQSKPHDELIQYALNRINEDRKNNGLPPVLLSDNNAAQVHADDVFKKKSISHWMSNGEKPYMTYTRYGGIGSVSQNIAIFECMGIGCNMDPIEQIDDSEHSMMYDDALSDWGHRDNIIRPYHTHVSIGITYNDRFFVMVQNFEDNYIDLINPIGQNPSDVRIIGNAFEGQLQNISIYYDEYPTPELYQIHKYDGSYSTGELIAIVEPPLSSGYYYDAPTGYHLIVAKSMSQSGHAINIAFDMSSVAESRGVYTITVWLKSNGMDIPATSYALFVE